MIKIGRLLLVATISTLLLSGCSSSTSSSQTGVGVVDIKDIVLTNTSGDCADYSDSYSAEVKDLKSDASFTSSFVVSGDSKSCSIVANDVPNYDFNDDTANFASDLSAQALTLTIARNPKLADSTSDLSMLTYNAVMLNGVVLDQISNGCYMPSASDADRDGNIANGCGLTVDWRLNPMGKVKFGTDSHNGHTQPGGMYHYHANPFALFDATRNDIESPVIGFAADGFPIYGPYYKDPITGKILEAQSGYTLKSGNRPTSDSSPGGSYDGTYIQDYEFTNTSTLDKCNGMTLNGQYGYHVTDEYPYVMGCYAGTPDISFFKFWDLAKWIFGGLALLIIVIVGLIILIIRKRETRKISQAIAKQGAINE